MKKCYLKPEIIYTEIELQKSIASGGIPGEDGKDNPSTSNRQYSRISSTSAAWGADMAD